MTWREVHPKKLLEPVLEIEDFYNVLGKVKPSVSGEETQRYQKWTEQYGSEGA